MLNVADLWVDYDGFQVLRGVSVELHEGEIVCILGPNGAGKSTLMNAISGLVHARSGTVALDGHRLDSLPAHARVARGIAHVLERRRLFPYLTVHENLVLGSYLPEARRHRKPSLERILALLPALRDRLKDQAYTLSGGLQQQVAIGRGLMSRPRILLLDEPFLGLSPIVVDDIEAILRQVRADGVPVLFIEQNVQRALELADRGYVLEAGTIAIAGSAQQLLAHERVVEVYLGVAF